MRRFLLIGVALLLVVVSIFVMYRYLGLFDFLDDGKGETVQSEARVYSEEDLAETNELRGPPYYQSLEPVLITVFEANRAVRHVEMSLLAQAVDETAVSRIFDRRDELIAGLTSDLTKFLSLQYEESGDFELYYLRRRARLVARRVLGKDTVHDILLQAFVTRRPR